MNMFNSVKLRRPGKAKFDLSHERKMSMRMGPLYPVYVQEAVPGDKFRVSTEIMMRFAPMLAPIMHRVNVYVHYFFVPNRLVWNEWEDFITGGREGTAAPVVPYVQVSQTADELMATGSLWDYMGLPSTMSSGAEDNQHINVLAFRAYQLIWDSYYRDQNLQASLDLSLASGEVVGTERTKILTMRQRAWEKDYFTSALPWAQRGGEVQMPIEIGPEDITYKSGDYLTSPDVAAGDYALSARVGADGDGWIVRNPGPGARVEIENIESIDGATTTINDLRRSIRLQEWLEKNARGGARYIEQILSHFGVKSSDARLQRPEYLGGGRAPVVVSEVLQTMEESAGDGNPLGTMGGHGVAIGRSNQFRKFFEEHGHVIGLVSVLPRTAYQQGIPRQFSRFDKFDYYWPEFAHIGEQEVKLKELYYNSAASSGSGDATFGYQSRYSEYKYQPSTVHGDFRDTLNFWHMGRVFSSAPTLSAEFVASDPTTRIFAVETGDNLWCQMYNKVDAVRPMPYYGTPML